MLRVGRAWGSVHSEEPLESKYDANSDLGGGPDLVVAWRSGEFRTTRWAAAPAWLRAGRQGFP